VSDRLDVLALNRESNDPLLEDLKVIEGEFVYCTMRYPGDGIRALMGYLEVLPGGFSIEHHPFEGAVVKAYFQTPPICKEDVTIRKMGPCEAIHAGWYDDRFWEDVTIRKLRSCESLEVRGNE
jgi:hypothetical protein